ncbi:hypothetical protein [Mariprofundus sp. KV]|uniref:hypothetical protein n=1 Tax=Mariprofundus sp. KV TaxID=2608715 RepID=UPI0015A29648|nr:hypothetical protein [Mariprofundus sp. KV]NWF36694.1 hypothetical protein [Mariprofundus sp. KV]
MKSNRLFHTLTMLMLAVLLLGGCGRKEAPQISSADIKPEIVNMVYKAEIALVHMNFSLQGNPAGVGYQIDRTVEDPYCKCPGFWRRYQDQTPSPKLLEKPINKMITLTTKDQEYLFRIRAYDIDGNIGPWSKTMRAKYHDPLGD